MIKNNERFKRLYEVRQLLPVVADKHQPYTTRGSHSLDVERIALRLHTSNIAQSTLRLVALAHDIGHPPFGHCGEEALQFLVGSDWNHDSNSVRIAETITKTKTAEVMEAIRALRSNDVQNDAADVVRAADTIALIVSDFRDLYYYLPEATRDDVLAGVMKNFSKTPWTPESKIESFCSNLEDMMVLDCKANKGFSRELKLSIAELERYYHSEIYPRLKPDSIKVNVAMGLALGLTLDCFETGELDKLYIPQSKQKSYNAAYAAANDKRFFAANFISAFYDDRSLLHLLEMNVSSEKYDYIVRGSTAEQGYKPEEQKFEAAWQSILAANVKTLHMWEFDVLQIPRILEIKSLLQPLVDPSAVYMDGSTRTQAAEGNPPRIKYLATSPIVEGKPFAVYGGTSSETGLLILEPEVMVVGRQDIFSTYRGADGLRFSRLDLVDGQDTESINARINPLTHTVKDTPENRKKALAAYVKLTEDSGSKEVCEVCVDVGIANIGGVLVNGVLSEIPANSTLKEIFNNPVTKGLATAINQAYDEINQIITMVGGKMQHLPTVVIYDKVGKLIHIPPTAENRRIAAQYMEAPANSCKPISFKEAVREVTQKG
jgi:HD domain